VLNRKYTHIVEGHQLVNISEKREEVEP